MFFFLFVHILLAAVKRCTEYLVSLSEPHTLGTIVYGFLVSCIWPDASSELKLDLVSGETDVSAADAASLLYLIDTDASFRMRENVCIAVHIRNIWAVWCVFVLVNYLILII